jgi:hypothetical protein
VVKRERELITSPPIATINIGKLGDLWKGEATIAGHNLPKKERRGLTFHNLRVDKGQTSALDLRKVTIVWNPLRPD